MPRKKANGAAPGYVASKSAISCALCNLVEPSGRTVAGVDRWSTPKTISMLHCVGDVCAGERMGSPVIEILASAVVLMFTCYIAFWVLIFLFAHFDKK